jgi:hypothetical protein
MTDKQPEKLELVDNAPEDVFDDIEALRKTATLKVSRRIVSINVTVGKPKNNVYFRCHPDPDHALDASVITGGEGSDDFYFVTPVMLSHHVTYRACARSPSPRSIPGREVRFRFGRSRSLRKPASPVGSRLVRHSN